jgi:hypothetical protein
VSRETQGTYRFDVDIPECPKKPYHTFHVFVERNAAPPPPTPSPPPPPFVNYIRVSFTTRFPQANFSALTDQHDAIREEFIALLVAESGIDRCVCGCAGRCDMFGLGQPRNHQVAEGYSIYWVQPRHCNSRKEPTTNGRPTTDARRPTTDMWIGRGGCVCTGRSCKR